MKLKLALAFTFLWSTQAFAQSTVLGWDFKASLDQVNKFTQTLIIDSTTVAGTPVCVATSPSTSSCSMPVAALTAGNHTLSIEAVLNGSSAKTIFTNVDFSLILPNADNIRYSTVITIVAGATSTPTQPTTPSVPQQAPFDALGHKWTLESFNDVCDGQIVGGGDGSTALIFVSGKVYALVPPNWYINNTVAGGPCSLSWTPVGTTTPK